MPKPESDIDDVCANYLKALADSNRLKIVKALQMGPLTVSDLAELLEVDIQKISHHLRILFHAQVLTVQKDGKYRYYRLSPSLTAKRSSGKELDLGCCTIGLRVQ